jgi:ubiquinone/menaquinone biosynthesis C-methylase UbiE
MITRSPLITSLYLLSYPIQHRCLPSYLPHHPTADVPIESTFVYGQDKKKNSNNNHILQHYHHDRITLLSLSSVLSLKSLQKSHPLAMVPATPLPESATTIKHKERSGQTSKIWDRYAEKYAQQEIVDKESYQKKIKITQQYLKRQMNVVEIGCGTGEITLLHAPYVRHILATDISGKMIDIGKRKLKDEFHITNVEFQQTSIDQLQLESSSIHAVLGFSMLHLLKNRYDAISKISKWLRPNGLFISSTMCMGDANAANIGFKIVAKFVFPIGNFFGLAPYVSVITKKQLKDDLEKNGFTIEYEWQPSEKAAVFIVARKLPSYGS